MTPVIFHIDVNSAYLSWTAVEQLKNGAGTDLRKIPSIRRWPYLVMRMDH